MKKSLIALLIMIATFTFADLGAYGTYWNGDDEGYGGGVKYEKEFLGFFAADIKAGYVDFDDNFDTSVIPVEATVTVRWPILIEPYIGVGAGYNFIDSDLSDYDDCSSVFGVLGIQADLLGVGVFVEGRYVDAEEDFLDGETINFGLNIRW